MTDDLNLSYCFTKYQAAIAKDILLLKFINYTGCWKTRTSVDTNGNKDVELMLSQKHSSFPSRSLLLRDIGKKIHGGERAKVSFN